ncbi:MAG: acyltransferase domain-containing protein, partial [Gemmatimonadota bacterium]
MSPIIPPGPWYHGSPAALTALRAGSMVTPFEAVARAFSHKPHHLSFGGDPSQVKHDGEVPGFLYVVDEDLAPGDLTELPGTASTHWEVRRDLRVRLVAEVPVDDPPRLTEVERTELERQHAEAGGGTGMIVGPTEEAARLFHALGIRGQALEALSPHWADSAASRPADLPPFLDPGHITRSRALAQLPAEADAALLEAARRIAASPDLRALAWHCDQLLFEHDDYPGATQARLWPHPIAPLGDLSGAFYLLIALDAIPRMRQVHRQRGIPEEVSRANISHFPVSLERYRDLCGQVGVLPRVLYWLRHHVRGDLYRLGRLEYMAKPFRGRLVAWRHRRSRAVVALASAGARFDAEGILVADDEPAAWTAGLDQTPDTVTGTPISPRGHAENRVLTLRRDAWEVALSPDDPVLEVHIPAGGGMTPAACRDSMQRALDFFPRYFPERPFVGFACASWILNPQLETIYRPDSNMVLWQRQLYLHPFPNRA